MELDRNSARKIGEKKKNLSKQKYLPQRSKRNEKNLENISRVLQPPIDGVESPLPIVLSHTNLT